MYSIFIVFEVKSRRNEHRVTRLHSACYGPTESKQRSGNRVINNPTRPSEVDVIDRGDMGLETRGTIIFRPLLSSERGIRVSRR